jgi:hypothetical protein
MREKNITPRPRLTRTVYATIEGVAQVLNNREAFPEAADLLQDIITELANNSQVWFDHPDLLRPFLLACARENAERTGRPFNELGTVAHFAARPEQIKELRRRYRYRDDDDDKTTEATYCRPRSEEGFKTYLVNTDDMQRAGLKKGMALVCREVAPFVNPPAGSIILARIQGDRFTVRLVKRLDNGWRIATDEQESDFDDDEVCIEAVARHACSCQLLGRKCEPLVFEGDGVDEAPASADETPATVVNLAAWLDSHPRPIKHLLFAEKA